MSHAAEQAAFWRRAAAVCERNCQPIRAQMFKNLAWTLEQEDSDDTLEVASTVDGVRGDRGDRIGVDSGEL